MENTKNKYSEKIQRLTAAYQDKSLSRAERQEAFRELARFKYLADSRPSISVRKQSAYAAVMLLIEGIFFGFVAFVDRQTRNGSVLDTLFSIGMIVVFILMIVLAVRYKNEPDDEFSLSVKQKATRYAGIAMLIITGAAAIICFDFLGLTFTLHEFNWMGFFMMTVCLFGFLSRVMFLICEGREALEEE